MIITSAEKTMMYFSRFDVSCEDGHLSVTEAFTNDVIYGNVKAYELKNYDSFLDWIFTKRRMHLLRLRKELTLLCYVNGTFCFTVD